MSKKKESSSEQFKELLSTKVGGEAKDWKRLSKKTYAGDTERKFENKKLGMEVSVTEREDGLIYAALPNGASLTARLAKDGTLDMNPSAVDQVMNLIYESADEIPDALYNKAVKEGLAKQFSFMVAQGAEDVQEEDEVVYVALIYPSTKDSTFKCSSFIEPMVPEVDSVDSCCETEWYFKKRDVTPEQIAEYMEARGFTWDEQIQKDCNKDIYDRLKAAREDNSPAASDVSIETDPAKNAAADQIIRIIMGDEERSDDDDADYGVPQKLIDEAGKALANRYCFALSTENEGIEALITPIRFFEEEGHCSDQTGPIRDLLPKCGEAMESTWEIYDDKVKTPIDAGKYLQSLGFHWNKDFQDYIQKSLTKELSDLAPKPTSPKLCKTKRLEK